MTLNAEEMECLLDFHARYMQIWSQITQTPNVWYFDCPDLPYYHSANCAKRLRVDGADGRGMAVSIAQTVSQIMAHFRARGLAVVADVDPIAEAQGFGRELRRRGVLPGMNSTLLMRHTDARALLPASVPPCDAPLSIRRVPNDLADTATWEWARMAGAEEEFGQGSPVPANAERDIVAWEARSPDCRLYLATWDGQPAGACQWFAHNGWAQIDSVMTHPAWRRRGVATRLVTQAARDALDAGNTTLTLYTDKGGAGEQVYRRLGFETWGVDVWRRHILW